MKRPIQCNEEHLQYLDDLRDSSETNMMGASVYIQMKFNIPHKEAKEILMYWMDSFGERHKAKGK